MRDDHPAEQYRTVMVELYAAPPEPPPAAPTATAPARTPAGYRMDWSALVFALFVLMLLVLYLRTG